MPICWEINLRTRGRENSTRSDLRTSRLVWCQLVWRFTAQQSCSWEFYCSFLRCCLKWQCPYFLVEWSDIMEIPSDPTFLKLIGTRRESSLAVCSQCWAHTAWCSRIWNWAWKSELVRVRWSTVNLLDWAKQRWSIPPRDKSSTCCPMTSAGKI